MSLAKHIRIITNLFLHIMNARYARTVEETFKVILKLQRLLANKRYASTKA